ncbi:ABC transporter substrate-binding protein [Aerococcaceae bacterium DSM 111022]|nr:ABC transporter substrate-binding protein [Aerococcaceae bacterium DSM 111022]
MMKNFIKAVAVLTVLLSSFAGIQLTASAQEETIKIGILQYVEHEALDAAREGFIERLEESEYGDRIEFDVQNASGNQTTLQSISEKIARDNDILYAIATPAAISLASLEQEKPIFIAAVTDPVEAGLADSLEDPGRNVTGTSDMQPLEEQVDLLVNNFPDAENIGLIYNSSEVNSQIQADQAIELLEERGLETVEATVVSTNDIAQALNSIITEVDAMFMVTDNTIDSAITLVGDIAKENNVPTIGSSDAVVEQNGLATISNSYTDYGTQTADMVIRMLDEGLTPAEMPIELGKDFEIVVNAEFAEAIGIDPESIK